jgi:hypothetical protein
MQTRGSCQPMQRVFLYSHDPLQHYIERKSFIEESLKSEWNHSLTSSPLVFDKRRKSAGVSFVINHQHECPILLIGPDHPQVFPHPLLYC